MKNPASSSAEAGSRRSLAAAVLATVIGLLWLAIFPLWQGGTYSHITLDKWHGMLILTGITLACGIAELVLRRPRSFPVRPLLFVLLIAFLGWQTLSALNSPYLDCLNKDGQTAVWWGARRHEGMVTFACYGAIFLISAAVRPKLKWIVRGAAVTLMLYGLTVALQYAGVNVLGLFPKGLSVFTNYEFQGTIGNIDMVSGYTVLVTGLTLTWFLRAEKADWTALAGGLTGILLLLCIEVSAGLVALAFGALLLLHTVLSRPETRVRAALLLCGVCLCAALRSALILPWHDGGKAVAFAFGSKTLLCLVGAAVLAFAARLLKRHPLPGLSGWKAWLVTAACVLLAVLLLTQLPMAEGGGLWEIRQVLRGQIEDSYGNWRIGVWRHTLELAKDRLMLGTGRDTFWFAFNDSWHAKEPALRAAGKLAEGARLESFDAPHNEYLSYLSNDGLPALLLYLALLLGTLLLGLKAARRGEKALPAAAALFAVQAFFSFSICLVSPMFWCVLGLTAGLARPGRKTAPDEDDK